MLVMHCDWDYAFLIGGGALVMCFVAKESSLYAPIPYKFWHPLCVAG